MAFATVQARKVRPRMGLALDYAPHVPMAILGSVEKVARKIGLPLQDLELLGQDQTVACGFLDAYEAGVVAHYLERVDWDALEASRAIRYPVYN